MDRQHIIDCVKNALAEFDIAGDEYDSVINKICEIYTSDGKHREELRERFFNKNNVESANYVPLFSFLSMFLRAFPPGKIRETTTEKNIIKATNEFLVKILEITTNGCSKDFLSAIASEAYEGRNTKSLSVAFVPSFQVLSSLKNNSTCGLHRFFPAKSPSEDYKDYLFDDSLPGSNGQRRAIRKALELSKEEKEAQKDSVPQCLLVAPNAQKRLYMVGIANSAFCRKFFPTVKFLGPSSWSFALPALPDVSYATFLCVAGKVLAPHPKEFREAYHHKIIRDCILPNIAQTDLDKTLNSVYKMLTEVQKQKHGTSMVWLWEPDAEKEKNRLCTQCHRGYLASPPIPAWESITIKSITGIDGALLCSINSGKCIAYGVILDGVVKKGDSIRARGARYNSIKTYLSSKSWNGQPFAVVVSEDGFVDVVTADCKKPSKK